MTILPGPLDKLYNSSKQGALLEEYTIYLKENGQIFCERLLYLSYIRGGCLVGEIY